jgi:hypothetical protein
VWLVVDTSIVQDILELKQNIRVYFYLRNRRKKNQQKSSTTREYANATFSDEYANSGKLILDRNGFHIVWLWLLMLYNCRLHNKVKYQYV